jgi:aerobic carbon-monoxide dehydrogenase small subunit
MPERIGITLKVNGEEVRQEVPARLNLADFIRQELALTGTHVGCEHGVCGACTLRVNGKIVRSCLMLAAQADGCEVQTIEGLAESGEIAALQTAFIEHNALQCGYCTPGMLFAAADYVAAGRPPSRAAVREHLSGNYCRCTGYQSIVEAVCQVAAQGAAKGARK